MGELRMREYRPSHSTKDQDGSKHNVNDVATVGINHGSILTLSRGGRNGTNGPVHTEDYHFI
jgi:hypothetical protein